MSALDGVDYINGDAMVVHLAGSLDPADLIQILGALTLTRPWLLLDLARVPELDPGVLAVVAGAQRRLRRHGYGIALWQLGAQPWQLVHDRGIVGSVDVVDGDLHRWLVERRHPDRAHLSTGADLRPHQRWAPLVSVRVVSGLGMMTGEIAAHQRGPRGHGTAGQPEPTD
jgi:hypothetical protein